MRQTVALLLLACPAAAQTVVTDGDDLAAVCAAAADGVTIEIHSDGTFVGTLSWDDKDLTVEAGPGFAPTVVGDAGEPTIEFDAARAGLVLRGVRVETAEGAFRGIEIGGSDSLPIPTVVELADCDVLGGIDLGGGSFQVNRLTLVDTDVQGTVFAGGCCDAELELRILDQSRIERLDLSGSGDSVLEAEVLDSRIDDGVDVSVLGDPTLTATLRRCRIEGGVDAWGATDVLLESCLVLGDGTGRGIDKTFFEGTIRGVNLTVTGFETGLYTGTGPAEFVNCAVFDNTDDVGPFAVASSISSSLVGDGTFAGLNGNLGGMPTINGDFALVAGSLGIDAGDSAAIDLGTTDLDGAPRVQDGDGDGLAAVNVGAVETVAPCVDASFTYVNGNGVNPTAMTLGAPPVLNQVLPVDVAGGAQLLVTVVGIGLPAPAPLVLPGFAGELLLAPAPAPLLDVATGTHLLPLPADPNLCGKSLLLQGVRIATTGTQQFLNGALLTLGL